MTNFNKKHAYDSFAIAIFCYVFVQVILASILQSTTQGSFLYCLVYLLLSLSILGIAFLCAKVGGVNLLQGAKANVKPNVIHILWGCLATVGLIHLMLPINELLLDFIEFCGLKRPSTNINLPIPALVVLTVFVAPVSEETLFRGIIGNGLTSEKRPLLGIALSGLLFAIFHFNPAQTLHQFVLGCFLMLLVYRSGSLWTSIIVHAFNNLVVVILSLTVEPTGFYQNNMLLVGIVGGLAFAGGIVGYLLTTKKAQNISQTTQQKMSAVNWVLFALAVGVCVALWISNLLGV